VNRATSSTIARFTRHLRKGRIVLLSRCQKNLGFRTETSLKPAVSEIGIALLWLAQRLQRCDQRMISSDPGLAAAVRLVSEKDFGEGFKRCRIFLEFDAPFKG
jgi:hypothetical protein